MTATEQTLSHVDAAKYLRTSPKYVCDLCREGRLDAFKRGRLWWIALASLQDWSRRWRGRTRPLTCRRGACPRCGLVAPLGSDGLCAHCQAELAPGTTRYRFQWYDDEERPGLEARTGYLPRRI